MGQLYLSQYARLTGVLQSDIENNTKKVMAVSLRNRIQLVKSHTKHKNQDVSV